MPDLEIKETRKPGLIGTIQVSARKWAPVVVLAGAVAAAASALVGYVSYGGQWPGPALRTLDSVHTAEMRAIKDSVRVVGREQATAAVLLRDLIVPMAKRDCYQVSSEFADLTNMKCDSLLGGNHWRRRP